MPLVEMVRKIPNKDGKISREEKLPDAFNCKLAAQKA